MNELILGQDQLSEVTAKFTASELLLIDQRRGDEACAQAGLTTKDKGVAV